MIHTTAKYISVASLVAGLVLAGCNKSDQMDAKRTMNDAYADSKGAISKAWDDVKDYSYDKKNDFTANAKSAQAKLGVQVSELRTSYSEAQASASRKAAMAELKDSESNYNQKLDALGSATADTWDSAKKNVRLAWDKLEASYYKARAN